MKKGKAISKEALLRPSRTMAFKISPDGNWLAKIGADRSGVPNLFIRRIGSSKEKKQTDFTEKEIIQFFWSADSKRVLLLKQEKEGVSLYGVAVDSGEKKQYIPPFSLKLSQIIKVSSSKNEVLLGVYASSFPYEDLYLLEIDKNSWQCVFQNTRFARFVVSEELDIVLKIEIDLEGGAKVFSSTDALLFAFDPPSFFNSEFMTVSSKEPALYLLDARFSDTQELVNICLKNKKRTILARGEKGDICDVLWEKEDPIGYAVYREKKKWVGLSPQANKEILDITNIVGENFEVKSQTRKGDIWILSSEDLEKGMIFWLYDRHEKNFVMLEQSGFERRELRSKTYPLIVKADDGIELVCYYTIPIWLDREGEVKEPLPLVVVPHGGPFHTRERLEGNLYDQWLSSCGYIVLRVNFRMSSGFGKAFTSIDKIGVWGKRAHQDLIEAIEICIAKGLSRKDRIGILGASYGGYEALMALGLSSNIVCCAVAICPISDLVEALMGGPPFWGHVEKALSDRKVFFTNTAYLNTAGGDPASEEGKKMLEAISPLSRIDEIQKPLLLIHGGQDKVVLEKQSKIFYEEMKKRGKEIAYLFFPDEGHRILRYSNRLMMWEEIERFFKAHLKGTFVPADPQEKQGALGVWID